MFSVSSRWLPGIAAVLLGFVSAPLFAQQPTPTPPLMPDPTLTPGDTLDVALSDIQERGYSSRVRNVPVSVKREVYASYGINNWVTGEYEIDHLIPLSIGGSNSKKNLWPESYQTQPWNAHVKDRLEYRLLALVRSGKLDLHTAQADIARDWIAAYKKYVGPDPLPASEPAEDRRRSSARAETERPTGDDPALKDGEPDTETVPAALANEPASPVSTPATGAEQVWVNTKSHVIWKQGSRYYGKTQHGQYMSAQDAIAAGNHYAPGEGN